MSTSIKALGQDEQPSVSHKEVLEYDEDSKQDQSSALEGSAEPAHIEWTEEESRRVRFKMDICILPLLCFLMICSFLDKSNIGNANTAGMSADLGLTNDQYTMLLTAFYIVYACSQWEILMLRFVQPRIWLFFVCMAWGLASAMQGVTTNFGGMITCRVLIAFFEAGGVPAISLYFSMLYPKEEYGLRWCIFQACAALSNAFAGALAYGIVQIKSSIPAWKLLFIIEAMPTFICGALILFFLPSGPGKCRFLNERENAVAYARVFQGKPGEQEKGLNLKRMSRGLIRPWTWLIAIIHFCGSTAFNSISVFLTAILRDMGFTSIKAQGMSAPPYIVAYIVAVAIAFLSDRKKTRGIFVAIFGLLGGAGYIIVAYAPSMPARYFGVFMVAVGVYTGQPMMYAWCANNAHSPSERGASLVLFSVTGQLGSILGSNIYPKHSAPRYYLGNTVCAGALFMSCVLSTIGTIVLRRRNRLKAIADAQRTPEELLTMRADPDNRANYVYTI
ncbi:major facilitator superfamily domain-containing protein [Filobasidium floriforme]|uniref:major facilitator superfamily domain-containing protein n=1 Tax=Filobasidium floriforme TaxID=5210 RepID=UPI001E8D774F|nr:major facilitator superfamily domain-containing protein [Filobasidium floriforme]KAH8085831.1 major facilitator superfamily domain-containing protein [Filobasidium floriforme]